MFWRLMYKYLYGHVFLFWGKYIGVEWIGYIKSLTF